MPKNKTFWIIMSVFQIIFGLAVFATTRHIYTDSAFGSDSLDQAKQSAAVKDLTLDVSPAMLESLLGLEPDSPNPAAMSLLANEYFADKQYGKAAELYEQLLSFGPGNADVHNNLGLTLHYLGRSPEAFAILAEGVALDPMNQRIWLTTGFINMEMQNIAEARVALTAAVEMNADNDIGQSAASMLADLE